MTRELFAKMLGAIEGVEQSEGRYVVGEGRRLELLYRAGSGAPAPLPRVREIQMNDGFVTVTTEDGTWYLPYETMAGVKTIERGAAVAPRTGFTR